MNEYEFNGFKVKTNYSKKNGGSKTIRLTSSVYDKYFEMENEGKCIMLHFRGAVHKQSDNTEEDILKKYINKCSKIMFADTMIVRGLWNTEYVILYPKKGITTDDLYFL